MISVDKQAGGHITPKARVLKLVYALFELKIYVLNEASHHAAVCAPAYVIQGVFNILY